MARPYVPMRTRLSGRAPLPGQGGKKKKKPEPKPAEPTVLRPGDGTDDRRRRIIRGFVDRQR